MKRKAKIDVNKLERLLGTARGGKVTAKSGYFGALQIAAEVRQRFQIPPGGGRATDRNWTERRLIPLAPETLARLSHLAKTLHDEQGIVIAPLQLAGLLLEHAAGEIDDRAAGKWAREHAAHRKTA